MPAPVPSPLTPAAAWTQLKAGNARFVGGTPRHPHHSQWRRRDLTASQHPFVAVLSCSDSRVPPEIVFDRGLGDVFAIRNAGHALDTATLGTIEYGVGVLGTPLLAVMGHEACGCIAAAMAAAATGEVPGGHIGPLLEHVIPSVHCAEEMGTMCAGEVMEEHVRQTVQGLLQRSTVVADAVRAGELGIVGLTYRLDDGAVTLLDWIGEVERPEDTSEETVSALAAQQSAAQEAGAAAAARAGIDSDAEEVAELQEETAVEAAIVEEKLPV
ncbi:MAG: carbonic anhydrase [Mobilicoccus sp.]|nr:carbonic anhydrase [Mobilicoccus sp.]